MFVGNFVVLKNGDRVLVDSYVLIVADEYPNISPKRVQNYSYFNLHNEN